MKAFKKFICAALIAVLALCFTGCGETNKNKIPALSAPENLAVSDAGVVSWNAVENAEYYIVVLNGYHYRCDGTTYTVGSTINDFTVSVMAMAKDGYKDSPLSAEVKFTGKGIPQPVITPPDDLVVNIKGTQLVGSGKQTKYSATVNSPDGKFDRNVTWSITDGKEYGAIDESGNFTASSVTEDKEVTIRATSNKNQKIYSEIIVCVAAMPTLTESMLNAVKSDFISFEGYMEIDLYTFGLSDKFEKTSQVSGISTQMNGQRWHASYVDASTRFTEDLHYVSVDGKAKQVALSLTNGEEYYPMTEEGGGEVSWEDAGLYNNFKNLTVSSFTFDETDWRYYYNGADKDLAQKMVASASPYDFDTKRFGLIIENGELLGIFAESNASFSIMRGYKAYQRLYSYINCGEDNVEVPLIRKFEHNPQTTDGGNIDHDSLQTAIENMRALESYKLDFTISSHMATGYKVEGYVETVVDGDYFFEPYDMTITNNGEIKKPKADSEYGFHKLDNQSYNSYFYDAKDGKYKASRAFKGDMVNAKASFAFAPEIFTAWQKTQVGGKDANIYYVDETMCSVASTFYYGVGNDAPLYGLFALKYEILADYTPYVVIQDGHFIEAGFFYFLGDMYGEVRVHYTDFNEATLSESFKGFENFVPRTPPVSWGELNVIDETLDGNEEEKNALEYFEKLFGSAEAAQDLPFFNELLGDTYGFGLVSYRKPGGSDNNVVTVILYYDVPLEKDRTINQTIKSAQDFLLNNGFIKNKHGEYVKGDVSALPYDNSLDFLIYIWKTVK